MINTSFGDARQYQFFVSRRELLPDGRRPKPVASELGLITLMRAYRAGEDLRSLATLHGFEEQQLLEAVVYGLNLPEYRSPKPPA